MDDPSGNGMGKSGLQLDHGIQKASLQRTNSPAQWYKLHHGD